MLFAKGSSRRHWTLGFLVASAVALSGGCDNTAEDPEKFPPADTSQAVKSSDAPLATNKDVDPAVAGVKAQNNKSDALPKKRVFLP